MDAQLQRLPLRHDGHHDVRRRRVALRLHVAGFQRILVARRLFGFETGEERRLDVQPVLVRRQTLELHVRGEARPGHGSEREQAHADVRRQQPALEDHDSGQYLELLYDGNSRITTVRDETLRAWTYQYTSNRLTSVTDPLSNSTLYIYDASNRISTVVDRANKMTRIVYDASSRVTDLYLGLYNRTTSSITWQYRWYTISGYANTRTRTVTDANNVASTFTLDERGT